jgi:hypothetical protein
MESTMPTKQTMEYCEKCGKQTLHIVQAVNHILHLLLSVVTGGFWIIVWICIGITSGKGSCTICGTTDTDNTRLSGREALAAHKAREKEEKAKRKKQKEKEL